MTIEEIDRLPFAASNVPANWDFRNKTQSDLDPLCFGAYCKTDDPAWCKIIYGGKERARAAVAELAVIGIAAELHPPTDSYLDGERIKGWSWNVRFQL